MKKPLSAPHIDPPMDSKDKLAVVAAVSGGLLASSCCIVQIVLNALAVSCAGFAVLTPFEGLFSVFTLGMLTFLLYRHGFSNRVLVTIGISVALILSRQAVVLINAGLLNGTTHSNVQLGFSVPNVKCDGCAAKIRVALNHHGDAVSIINNLDTQVAAVTMHLNPGKTQTDVRSSLEKLGYKMQDVKEEQLTPLWEKPEFDEPEMQ